uniref:Uncharacterized protein n=1 Tax=Arundo donax TaxID=35708 RepID=A0A0A8YDY5_ARUDO
MKWTCKNECNSLAPDVTSVIAVDCCPIDVVSHNF